MVQSFTAFDLDPDFVRAFFVTNLGRTARSRGRRVRIEAIQAALKPLTAKMEEERRREVEAAIAYLAGIQPWLTLQVEFGFTGAQVGRAVSWAITTLLADLGTPQVGRTEFDSEREEERTVAVASEGIRHVAAGEGACLLGDGSKPRHLQGR